ncbi:MAG: GNAT family N-acetyltransferase [Actinomycetota bacterium]
MQPIELRGPRVTLSIPSLADVPAITVACQDPEIARWTSVPSPYTRDSARWWVIEHAPRLWDDNGAAWTIRADGELAGVLTLIGRSFTSRGIGFWLAEPFRGRGILHESLGLALDFAFDTLGLTRVRWSADAGNWPAWRAVWRHGFRMEGLRRAALPHDLDPHAPSRDLWVGALLATDLRSPAAPWTGPDGIHPAIPDPRDPEALVRQFHATFGLPVSTGPASVDTERVHMRMALIAEEFAELMGAVYGDDAEQHVLAAVTEAVASDTHHRDTVAAADALADLIYVIYGMALETGIPLDAVLHAVQRSNMSKLGENGRPIHRADGKVLKGPGFFEPKIAEVLATTRLTAD